MRKMSLDLETLAVETFATAPEPAEAEAEFPQGFWSRRSCIEQCTTSCVP